MCAKQAKFVFPRQKLVIRRQNSAVSFSTYSQNGRVPVTSVSKGAAGVEDDTFVVSFMATPSAAGTNPAISAQQGIWTVRVDVRRQFDTGNLDLITYTANSVVQAGDTIDGNSITSLSLADGIAGVNTDLSGVPRAQMRGDHQIVFWASTASGAQMIVRSVLNGCLATVPMLYKQGAAPWGSSLYDTDPASRTIGTLGCGLTSLSMALFSAGIRNLPNGEVNQPGKLNQRMVADSGYDGTSVNWLNTVKSVDATLDFEMYGGFTNSIDSPIEAKSILDNAVCTLGVPVIVGVKLGPAPERKVGHFVVVTGKRGTDYTIADPAGPAGEPRTLGGSYGGQFATRGSVLSPAP